MKEKIKELKREIRILKDLFDWATQDWDFEESENEGERGTITWDMENCVMKQSLEYFKKNYMYENMYEKTRR